VDREELAVGAVGEDLCDRGGGAEQGADTPLAVMGEGNG